MSINNQFRIVRLHRRESVEEQRVEFVWSSRSRQAGALQWT